MMAMLNTAAARNNPTSPYSRSRRAKSSAADGPEPSTMRLHAGIAIDAPYAGHKAARQRREMGCAAATSACVNCMMMGGNMNAMQMMATSRIHGVVRGTNAYRTCTALQLNHKKVNTINAALTLP